MTVPSRDETKLIVGAIFGGRVNRTRPGATTGPLAVGEVMGDLIAQAKSRHPSGFVPSR